MCAAVNIPCELKRQAVILTFKFIVLQRRTRDAVQKFGKIFSEF